MIIKTGKLCNIGGRQKNDDTVEIISGSDAVRAYVGDGLGSYAGGKQASQTAGDALLTFRGSMLTEEAMHAACQQAQSAVNNLQKETNGTMKTTIVLLDIEGNQARWMHVGDSRLYHFVNGRLVKQTTDHSVSQMAVMMGEITTHQIRFHEDRNRVLRSLGGENAKAEVSPVVDLSGANHAFLLCSDGFWEYVYEEEMEHALQQSTDPQEWIDRMEKILLQRVTGNNDNYTAGAVFAYTQDPAVVMKPGEAKARKGKKRTSVIVIPFLLAAVAAATLGGLFALKLRSDDTVTLAEETSAAVTEAQETQPTVPETTVPETTVPETTVPETTSPDAEPNVVEDFPDEDGSNNPELDEGTPLVSEDDADSGAELQNNDANTPETSVPPDPTLTDPNTDSEGASNDVPNTSEGE